LVGLGIYQRDVPSCTATRSSALSVLEQQQQQQQYNRNEFLETLKSSDDKNSQRPWNEHAITTTDVCSVEISDGGGGFFPLRPHGTNQWRGLHNVHTNVH
jgi:hypothetical protein